MEGPVQSGDHEGVLEDLAVGGGVSLGVELGAVAEPEQMGGFKFQFTFLHEKSWELGNLIEKKQI